MPDFLTNVDVAPKSCEKVQLLCRIDATNLLIEFAVTVDAGESFIKACYTLEGDGPLALSCYEVLSTVRASIQVKHWPNTRALVQRFAAEHQIPALEQLEWWKKHEEKLPRWSAACCQVVLHQPSSAAVERVFSSLKSSFGDQQC